MLSVASFVHGNDAPPKIEIEFSFPAALASSYTSSSFSFFEAAPCPEPVIPLFIRSFPSQSYISRLKVLDYDDNK
jgi:hypothetical protein